MPTFWWAFLLLLPKKSLSLQENNPIMAITSDRLRQTFSEGGALEIYHEIKSGGDFLGFTKQYAFDSDYRVARSALWGLTKAIDKELSQLQVLLNELIEQALHTENPSVRRFPWLYETMEISYYKPAVKGLRAKILNGKYQ